MSRETDPGVVRITHSCRLLKKYQPPLYEVNLNTTETPWTVQTTAHGHIPFIYISLI